LLEFCYILLFGAELRKGKGKERKGVHEPLQVLSLLIKAGKKQQKKHKGAPLCHAFACCNEWMGLPHTYLDLISICKGPILGRGERRRIRILVSKGGWGE
jgi:hypothetical protein